MCVCVCRFCRSTFFTQRTEEHEVGQNTVSWFWNHLKARFRNFFNRPDVILGKHCLRVYVNNNCDALEAFFTEMAACHLICTAPHRTTQQKLFYATQVLHSYSSLQADILCPTHGLWGLHSIFALRNASPALLLATEAGRALDDSRVRKKMATFVGIIYRCHIKEQRLF